MKADGQLFAVMLFTKLSKVVQTFECMKSCGVTIQMKVVEQGLYVTMFIMAYKVILTFTFAGEKTNLDFVHSRETFSAAVRSSTVRS